MGRVEARLGIRVASGTEIVFFVHFMIGKNCALFRAVGSDTMKTLYLVFYMEVVKFRRMLGGTARCEAENANEEEE
ncbi:MAG: hypothetical protein MR616_03840 [Pyramidobacter sp.]|nr:hypothetical protein [Pyramidobacter sp.]